MKILHQFKALLNCQIKKKGNDEELIQSHPTAQVSFSVNLGSAVSVLYRNKKANLEI